VKWLADFLRVISQTDFGSIGIFFAALGSWGTCCMTFDRILGPGILLMRRLQFRVKLMGVSLLVLIPLIIVSYLFISKQHGENLITKVELDGVVTIDAISSLVREVQSHRGQTNMVLSGNAAAKASVEKTRDKIKTERNQLEGVLNSSDWVEGKKAWPALRDRVDGLALALEGKDAAASFALHTVLVDDLLTYTYDMANESGLLYDPDPLTYTLMDITVSRLFPWREHIAKLRGQGAGLLSQATLSDSGVMRMRLQREALDDWTLQIKHVQSIAASFGHKDPEEGKAMEAIAGFSRLVQERFTPGAATGDAQAYFEVGTKALEAIVAYQISSEKKMKELLKNRLDSGERGLWTVLVLCLVSGALITYFLLSFEVSFMSDLRQVLQFMDQTAKGNLQHRVTIRGKDEISEMSHSMDVMVHNISAMVTAVRSNAVMVSHAGEILVENSGALSSRTEQQAANLEETSASVQELTSTVKGNASAAQAADAVAQQVRLVADQGSKGMEAAVASVEAIASSTKRMDEIVGVIDGLAFQTNILALNAAVEAARAGESGRGFAVVAGEVRSLAQRSATSAREIRELISTSSSQVATGVEQIRHAGEDLKRIVEGVRGLAINMTQLSTSSAEQSSSLAEISTAIRQLDSITQQNSSMVEQAVGQATALQARAGMLTESVSIFKLPQGSADEAQALVQRAVALRQSLGSREAFIRAVTLSENGLFDRDMYVFVLDSQGRYLAFGGNPSKVGSRVQDVPGVDGHALLASIMGQAAQGPGWVEYNIVNPVTEQMQTKLSYVLQIDDAYVGCGVYKNFMRAL
jgi:methyl-accepting chemotaxis protein